MEFKTFIAFLLIGINVHAQDNVPRVPCIDDVFCQKALPQEREPKCAQHFCMCLDSEAKNYTYCSMKNVKPVAKVSEVVISLLPSASKICSYDEDCAYIVGSKCKEDEIHKPRKTCQCPANYTMNQAGLECQPILYKLDDTCVETGQCMAGLGLASCVFHSAELDKNNKTALVHKCSCNPGTHLSKASNKCVLTKRHGEICVGGLVDECVEPNKKYTCRENRCIEEEQPVGSAPSRAAPRVFIDFVVIAVVLISCFEYLTFGFSSGSQFIKFDQNQ